MHTKKVAVINLKGGCAKTTTTLQLATMLAGKEDKHVLVIDLDPQTNATLALIGEDRWKQLNDQGLTLHTLFRSALDGSGSVDISNLIQKDVGNIGDVQGLDLVPSSLDMVDLQDRIGLAGNNQFAYLNPTDILLHALSSITNKYDYILFDCPPNLGLITLNGLRVADGFVIPCVPDYLSSYGIPMIVNRVERFSKSIGRPIICYGVIPTKVRAQSHEHLATICDLRKGRDAPCFFAEISESTVISRAAEYVHYDSLKQKWGYGKQFEQIRRLTDEFEWRCDD